jgi:preprotein translocase subunit SecD
MNKQQPRSGFRFWLLSSLMLTNVVGCCFWGGANPVRAQSTTLSCPSELLLEVQAPSAGETLTSEDWAAVQQVLQQRLNAMQVSDARIELQERDARLAIIIPPGNDPQEVARVLSATAQLEFREQIPGTETQLRDRFLERALLMQQANNEAELAQMNAAIAQLFAPTQLTGQNLELAVPWVTSSSSWEIYLEFDVEGAQTFAESAATNKSSYNGE